MDRGAWWATVHGVAKSLTQLNDTLFKVVISVGLDPQDQCPCKRKRGQSYLSLSPHHVQEDSHLWVGKESSPGIESANPLILDTQPLNCDINSYWLSYPVCGILSAVWADKLTSHPSHCLSAPMGHLPKPDTMLQAQTLPRYLQINKGSRHINGASQVTQW